VNLPYTEIGVRKIRIFNNINSALKWRSINKNELETSIQHKWDYRRAKLITSSLSDSTMYTPISPIPRLARLVHWYYIDRKWRTWLSSSLFSSFGPHIKMQTSGLSFTFYIVNVYYVKTLLPRWHDGLRRQGLWK
jgi:hypothetical protein